MASLDDDLLARARAALRADTARQCGVFTFAQATAAGLTAAHVRTLVRRGTWVSVRRGVLAEQARVQAQPHLIACAARLLGGGRSAVVSHLSAAVLHGFRWVDAPRDPVLTLPWARGASAPWQTLVSLLPDNQIELRSGLRVTSRERTLVDVLRTAPDRGSAQALADGASAAGLRLPKVREVLAFCEGWPGVVQAHEAWDEVDPLAESPLESRCRVWVRDGGLPRPESQVVLCGDDGQVEARVDFFFRQQGTVLEGDGRLKYTDPSVLWKEKNREDWIRGRGLEVVRATWADGDDHGADLVRRLEAAFSRAARFRG